MLTRVETRAPAARPGAEAIEAIGLPDRRKPKLGEKVAEAISIEIGRRGWPVGTVLGTEAELMARYGVSRATLREAIRQLERHGAVDMRRGVGGGLTVAQPALGAVTDLLATYLELANITVGEMLEVLGILEVTAAGHVADRVTDDGIAELRRLFAAIEAHPEVSPGTVEAHTAWRTALADMAQNPTLTLFMNAVSRLLARATTMREGVPEGSVEALKALAARKRRMMEAVVGGDRGAAEQAAKDDARARFGNFRALHDVGQRVAEIPLAGTSGLARASSDEPPKGKLAQAVARAIRRDIEEARLAEGERLGSETVLMGHYKVSKAIFREAVRTLELHGIVRTKRGQGGGLVTGHPDPSFTINAVETYLRSTRLKRANLIEVCDSLYIAAAQLAAIRTTHEEIAALQAFVRARADEGPTVRQLQNRICETSHNRALSLFARVLNLMLSTTPGSEGEAPPDAGGLQLKVVEAIAAHDPELARRRMIELVRADRQ